MERYENTLSNKPSRLEDNEEFELVMVMAFAGNCCYHFSKEKIIYIGENELVARDGDERWHIRNAVIVEVTRPVAKESKQNADIELGEKPAHTTENKIYYIQNTVDERYSKIRGYFSTLEKAKEELKKCSDWFRPKGTGKIYSINLDVLNDEPKLEYKA